MEIEELKNSYISYGGLPEEIEQINDEETLGLMVESQKSIHSFLEKEREEDDSEQKTDLEKLAELKESPASTDINSPEYLEHMNRITEAENRIRSKFSLPAKPKKFSDRDLTELLTLSDFKLNGETVTQFLKSIPDIATRKNYERRLREISNMILAEESRQSEYYGFVSLISENLSQLEKNPPDKFLIEKDGAIKPNKLYELWKNEVLEIKRKLGSRIKADLSLEKEGSPKADRRGSIYRLNEKVSKLIEQYHLEG